MSVTGPKPPELRNAPDANDAGGSGTVFVTRVVLRNYKSIAACDVRFRRPLTVLVGPNGAGKSNFLDALRFVSDSLRTSLDHAFRDRGGIKEVRRRSAGHPTHFSLRLEFDLPGLFGRYAFRVGSSKHGGYVVQEEECLVRARSFPSSQSHYRVQGGRVSSSSIEVPPAASPDRLYLVSLSGYPQFRPVYDALVRMAFYNPSPQAIRDLQSPDAGDLLARDGGNIASVLGRLEAREPEALRRIEEYLAKVVPGVRGVDKKVVGFKETLEFRQRVAGSDSPWRFPAVNMSDGTLRVLGILVALFQSTAGAGNRVPLVGIEEPETALNPGAAGVLLDGLRDASRTTQVIVTSHSPDLLDDDDIEPDSILAVVGQEGATKIGPLNELGRAALHQHLYTAGELLRLGRLSPDPDIAGLVEDQGPFLLEGEV